MPTIDPKLARELARVAARRLEPFGPATRAANFLLAQSLLDTHLRRGKVASPDYNVRLARRARDLEASPATPLSVAQRAGLSGSGALFSLTLWRQPVLHLRDGGGDFEGREWGFLADSVGIGRGRPGFRFWTPPVLLDHHLVERWIERTGDEAAAGLPRAALWAPILAGLYRDIASGDRRSYRAMDVVVPAPGGAFLGGTELVVSDNLGDGLFCDWDGEAHNIGVRDTPSRLVQAVSVRTFLDEALLSPSLIRVVGRIRRFEEETRREVMAGGTEVAFGWYAPDPALVLRIAPLAEEVQGEFDTWRRLLAEQGHTSIDFAAVRAAALRKGLIEAPLGEVVAKIARAMFVPEEAVELHLRAGRLGVDGRELRDYPWVPGLSSAVPGPSRR